MLEHTEVQGRCKEDYEQLLTVSKGAHNRSVPAGNN